jgi:hypothetical protein
LRTILGEATGWRGGGPAVLALLFALAMLALGVRAVGAVT